MIDEKTRVDKVLKSYFKYQFPEDNSNILIKNYPLLTYLEHVQSQFLAPDDPNEYSTLYFVIDNSGYPNNTYFRN